MKILWHSNSVNKKTGYAEETAIFSRALIDTGHEVIISAYAGVEGSQQVIDGIPHLPRGVDGYGNDVIQGHMVYTQADIVWTLIDAFALDLSRWRDLPWALYSVIDCEPIRPQETHHFQDARWVVAMSKFGAKQLENIGRQPLYVPHAIDTTVFRPTDREQGREILKLLAESGQRAHNYRTKPLNINDETFIITTCAANGTGWPSRKGFSLMLEAFAIFLETHPNSLFYIHSEPLGVWKGEPLLDMAAQYGLENKVLFPSSYVMLTGMVSKEMLNDVYNAADVFLLMSTGEGFGIPIAESQAAGCPVIVSNFSACRELCLTGWTVNGPYFQFTPMCKRILPDPVEGAARLTDAYEVWKRGDMPALRARTREQILPYDIKAVMKNHMLPALDQIATDLTKEPQVEWVKRRNYEERRKSGAATAQLLPPSRVSQNREKRRERRQVAREKR